jgi:hypothetical protein
VRTPIVASLAVILAACGGPLLGGEVQEQRVCIKKPTAAIQGLCRSSQVAAYSSVVNCSTDPGLALADAAIPQSIKDAIQSIPREANDAGTIPLGDNIPALDKKGTTGSLKLLSFTVSGSDQVLAQLSTFDLALTSPNETAPFVTFTYAKSADSYVCDDASPKTCTMTVTIDASNADADLFKRLNGGDIAYSVHLKGSAQALQSLWQDWTASIETCMSASLTVDALELIKNN